ncbi:MAG: hypothetical protein VW582_13840, partial [Rhodospirillaceae bacterium]
MGDAIAQRFDHSGPFDTKDGGQVGYGVETGPVIDIDIIYPRRGLTEADLAGTRIADMLVIDAQNSRIPHGVHFHHSCHLLAPSLWQRAAEDMGTRT